MLIVASIHSCLICARLAYCVLLKSHHSQMFVRSPAALNQMSPISMPGIDVPHLQLFVRSPAFLNQMSPIYMPGIDVLHLLLLQGCAANAVSFPHIYQALF
jgi:hypothetical protein